MAKKSTISKQKGVLLVADELFKGVKGSDIVRDFAEKYGLSTSAIDKWVKAARPIVAERNKEAEAVTRAQIKETREAMVKRLGLDEEAMLAEYKKLAFFNIKDIFTVDGGMKNIHEIEDDAAAAISGIENFDEKEPESGMVLGTVRKIKLSDKRAALDSIRDFLGYKAVTKVANTDPDGNALPANQPATIIIRNSDTSLEIKESE